MIGLFVGGFYGFTQIEGLGSIVLLLAAVVIIRLTSMPSSPQTRWLRDRLRISGSPTWNPGLTTALGILLFAGMGIAFDQPGNALYNRPIEWLFCPAETQLQRSADVTQPRAGTTVVSQNFTCVSPDGEVQSPVPLGAVIVIRFVEYILLGYLLLGLNYLLMRLWPRMNVEKTER